MPSQTEAGKAFEYALLRTAGEILNEQTVINIIQSQSLQVTHNCFNLFNPAEQQQYLEAATAAINHLIRLEPMVTVQGSVLHIQIMPDSAGIRGDVRDVLFTRPDRNWELGISAKNNHRAVKHSRLSDLINFGDDWLQIPCLPEYFTEIQPVFDVLRRLKLQGLAWKALPNKSREVYQPVLAAFSRELLRLNNAHPGQVPAALLSYLIGRNDFYKIVKSKNKIEINGLNLNGTLNMATDIRPQVRVSRLNLPSRIIELTPKPGSLTTLLLTCDQGWQLSFRIHNASTLIEPSLKFDINLVGHPQSIYAHHINW